MKDMICGVTDVLPKLPFAGRHTSRRQYASILTSTRAPDNRYSMVHRQAIP